LITEIGKAFDKHEQAIIAISNLTTDLESIPSLEKKPKVLFIYARGAGTLMVAGTDTQMHNFIYMAGAENAVTDFKDFKPLTPEALLQANPDAILLFSSGLESLEGTEGLMQIPGISETNAGKNKKFIAMDGALISGFGPRLGQGLKQMVEALQENKEV
jgi:iron complex transport system substrate-binding protein